MANARSELLPLMFHAAKGGSSFNAFYRNAREQGISRGRGAMLAIWRDAKAMAQEANRLGALAPTEYPILNTLSESPWSWTEPYVYKARVESELDVDMEPVERYVTVLSPEPLTMGEVVDQISGKWPGYEYGKSEKLVTIEPFAAIHWVG